jgi:hypothetical protein
VSSRRLGIGQVQVSPLLHQSIERMGERLAHIAS